jgi:ubiquinone/menaquinone biosynthesis C-methylase UbiE
MFGKNGPTTCELTRQALSSTQRGYDLLAPKFDATPFRTPDEILTPALEAVGSVDAALDLCCGTGAAMRLLLPKCRRRLVGVDFSPGMLEQARLQVAQSPDGVQPEWVEADVLDLTYSAEFDLITCFGALGHILPSDQGKFLRMVHRALRPGGRFILVSGFHPPLLSLRSLALRTFNGVMRVRNAALKPPFIMYYLTFLLPELKKALEETGFEVEVRPGQFDRPFQHYHLVIATRP